jgi:diguanylate cyclase (GGDEF)-like protein
LRQFIVKQGHLKSILFISVASVLFSETVTLVFLLLIPEGGIILQTRLFVALSIAFIVPAIVAPSASWVMVGLILEIHDLEGKMRTLATYDSLTGLLNKRAFVEQAEYGCRIAEREGLEYSVLVVDLDHFKKINDRYGHAVGDRILESFGKIAAQTARKSDLAGRIGGEEFAFFLPNTPTEKAQVFAERLHESIRETRVEADESIIRYTASIGLATFIQVKNIEEALKMADKALYQAKEKGRNRTSLYNADYQPLL